MSFREKLLNKSNSYVYYKNEHDSLKKSQKNLKAKISSLNGEIGSLNQQLNLLQLELNKKNLEIDILNEKYHVHKNQDKPEIIMLFFGYFLQIGGVAKVAFDRADMFYKDGYSVKILNIDPLQNFSVIEDHYHKCGYLNENLNIINVFDYYCDKNTLTVEDSKVDFDDLISNCDNRVEKKENMDNSVTLLYYDDSGNDIIKEELYISQSLVCSMELKDEEILLEKYYTYDNFNYLVVDNRENKVILRNRFGDDEIYFSEIAELWEYFVTEFCLKSEGKPILISDSSSFKPSIRNIDPRIAYKVANAHSNPYKTKPYGYGCVMRDITAISEYEYHDASVVLTEAANEDFKKEFNSDNFKVIPNFIREDEQCFENTFVDNKVISIFCRISPEKNLSDLIRAFSMVLKKHDDAVLQIFGRVFKPIEFKEKKKLDDLISELKIGDSVRFMGHIDNPAEYMNKSLITVLCSNFEGFGRVILESMYNYTPMVCYDTNYGPTDIIEHEVDGFIVKQYDVDSLAYYICYALDNPKSIYEMGFVAHEKVVNNFSETIVLQKWKNLFEEICDDVE